MEKELRNHFSNRKNQAVTVWLQLLIYIVFIPSLLCADYNVKTPYLPNGYPPVHGQHIITHRNIVLTHHFNENGLQRLFLYTEGAYTELLPTGMNQSSTDPSVKLINDRGDILLYGSNSANADRGWFLYNSGVYTRLKLPNGYDYRAAPILGNDGIVLMTCFHKEDSLVRLIIYQGGTFRELLPAGMDRSETYRMINPVNEAGDILFLGSNSITGDRGWFLYSSGIYIRLEVPAVDNYMDFPVLYNDGKILMDSCE